mmetsp:Transcript_53217/g.130411  ORF Transcript_53217/g.130411 Transcript_53217/m.130411 type:complete len:227 (+) Transcript_53217:586-1266(+)
MRPLRFAAIFTASLATSFDSLSMAAFRPSQIISFSATMSTAASNPSKPLLSCWPTRSATQKISSFSVATMSVPRSTAYTAFMTSVAGGTMSSCGRPFAMSSIASPSPPLLTRRFFASTVDFLPSTPTWSKFVASCAPQTSPTRACSAISYGPTRTRIPRAGARTTAASRSPLARTLCRGFCSALISTSSAALTKWWRTAMSFLETAAWSRSFRRPTTPASLTMLVP